MHSRAPIVAIALALAACGSDATQLLPDGAPAPDAGVAHDATVPPDAAPPLDGGPPPSLTRLDWRELRGAPLAATSHTLPVDSIVAVHAGGFVARASGCEPDAPCDHTWYDLDATPLRTRKALLAPNRAFASPDATRLVLLEHQADESCGSGEPAPAALGTLHVLDVATGDSLRAVEDYRAYRFSPQAFVNDDWLAMWSLPPGSCNDLGVRYQSAAPPHHTAAADLIHLALPGARFAGWQQHLFGVQRDLRDPTSFVSLGESPSAALASPSGWVHATVGYAFNVYTINSIDPAGERHTTHLDPEAGWLGLGAVSSGRWVRLCRDGIPDEHRFDCLIVDTLGEHAASQVTVATPAQYLLAGAANRFLYVGYAGDGKRALFELDLVHRSTLALAPPDDLRMFATAAGDVAVVHSGNRLLLVDEEHGTTDLLDDVVQVYGFSEERASPRLPQSRTLFIVSAHDDGTHSLHVFDLPTRRLVTLTDHLHHSPHLDGPLFVDDCGQPAFVRGAGNAHEQLLQPARQFFFTETATATQRAAVWVAPVALDAPPRRLATLAHNPVTCRPPLASPDGARVVLVDTAVPGAALVTIAR